MIATMAAKHQRRESGDTLTVEGRPVNGAQAPAKAELSHGDGDGDGDGSDKAGDDDGDDEVEVYTYVMVTKNGLVTHFHDARDPIKMRVELKMSLAYPLLHDSMWTEAEEAHAEALAKADPRRFGKKDARIYALTVGEGIVEDDGSDYGYMIDPREVIAIVPEDMYGPPPPDDDEDEDDDAPAAATGPGGAASTREQLRSRLGRQS